MRGKLVNTFSAVPDAPVSHFELRLRGGRRGILIVNGNPCRRKRVVDGARAPTSGAGSE